MLLAFLYLGEGGKWASHRGLYLGSSDPIILQWYIKLLNKCYGLTRNQFKASICYRADQNLEELKKYWSKVISIPLKNFYNSKPDPGTIGKPTRKKDYRGVCALTCAGTFHQLELELIPKVLIKGV